LESGLRLITVTTSPRNRRPLQAILLNGPADAPRLTEPLRAALDGTGPAILPVDAGLAPDQVARLIEAFQADEVVSAGGELIGRSGSGSGAAQDTAVIISTSGSTGVPKGVELSAAALRASARASLARVGARAGQRWLACLPVTHVAGLQVLVRSLESGTEPAVAAVADAESLAGTLARHDAPAHVSIVPTQLVRLMGTAAGREALAGFSSVLVGGAAAAAALLEQARAAGVRAVTTYGMSETCGGCVYDGVPLDGVSVRAGDDGRLRISGPVLMNGYHGQPSETSSVLVDDPLLGRRDLRYSGGQSALLGAPPQTPWPAGATRNPLPGTREFVTSDLGYIDDAGRVVVRGRADDVINTGGHKVVPGEVADVLSSCPGVREVVVVGRPDPEWGERVTAVVVPADRAYPPTLELLRIHVRTALPRYACPTEVVLADAIPVLSNGKPDLARLRTG
jgi:O-succinylbenzoic acid--CoA ligase